MAKWEPNSVKMLTLGSQVEDGMGRVSNVQHILSNLSLRQDPIVLYGLDRGHGYYNGWHSDYYTRYVLPSVQVDGVTVAGIERLATW